MILPERASVCTDGTFTGLKHIVSRRKPSSLVAGTDLVRRELTGQR